LLYCIGLIAGNANRTGFTGLQKNIADKTDVKALQQAELETHFDDQ